MNIIRLESNKKILITGAAGFIGFHLSKSLLHLGYDVVGIDNINDYYDINLKYARLRELGIQKIEAETFLNEVISKESGSRMIFVRIDLKDAENIKFRKSYLPTGATKKSIPYAERYTDNEKSELYRKRKENEANDDRITKRERIINKRERDKKYYKELKKDKKRLENKRQRNRKSAISKWINLSQEDWEIKKQRDREYQAKRTKDLN